MRIAFIGCVALSETILAELIAMPEVQLVGVVTRDASPINADFRSLAPLAEKAGCPMLRLDGNDQPAIAAFLRERQPDSVLCVGWSYLLDHSVLSASPGGVIGYHPAALPRNRGRHPLIWALALGLTETASTFFRMDEGADSGPIVDQRSLAIEPDDDASSLYDRMTRIAVSQIRQIVRDLSADDFSPVPQDDTRANIWRKRSRADGRIDWRMDAAAIYNLVRALAKPYVGAHCETAAGDVHVWRAEIGPAAPANLEPGKVLGVDGRTLLVKCYGGTIRLLEHEFDPLPRLGAYL